MKLSDLTEATAKLSNLMSEITRFAQAHRVEIRIRVYGKDPRLAGSNQILQMTDLNAEVPGQGNGTKVMQKLGQLADAAGCSVITMPSSGRNKEFYRRFDFEPAGGSSWLVRHPMPKA